MKVRNWLMRVMAGRYGLDQLGRALNVAAIVLLLLSLLTGRSSSAGSILWVLAILSLAWGIYRAMSRNGERRRRENAAWLRCSGKLTGHVRGAKQRFQQRKEYRFFRCPSCGTWLRVPRGKGKVNITCRQCGERFTRST